MPLNVVQNKVKHSPKGLSTIYCSQHMFLSDDELSENEDTLQLRSS